MTTLLLALAAVTQDIPKEYADVLTTLGKAGDYSANVLRINLPRNDLKVSVDGTDLPTSFGFGGWLAMTKGDGGAEVMMGDLVLTQDEVNPVMSALFANGLEVTALHNHFFWEEPRVFYMHVHGVGSAVDLARRVKPAVDLMGTVKAQAPKEHAPRPGALDTAALDAVVGVRGVALAGGTYKYTLGRPDFVLKEMGAVVNSRMGLNSWASFFGSDESAVVAGDVAMLAHELTPVMKALRAHGIQIVAVHNHMTSSAPAVYFLHYWGRGRAVDLARGFKASLDATGKPAPMKGHGG